jgi:hypothetical protein
MKLKIKLLLAGGLTGSSLFAFDQKVTDQILFSGYWRVKQQYERATFRAERDFWAKELAERETQIREKHGDLQAFIDRYTPQVISQDDKK